MKKILTLALAAAMLSATGITAFVADTEVNQDTPAPQSGSTSVTMSVAPSYTVTIPESVVLNEQTDGTYSNDAVITATNIRLNNKIINVTMDSDFLLENAQGAVALPYTLTINNKEKASGDTVATFSTNADLTLVQQSDTMHFTADVPTYAGDYSDTVTFTISVNDSSIKAYILDDSFMPTETTITIPVNTGMAWGESATALSDEEVEVFLNNLLNDVPDTAHPADTLYSVNLSEDETKEERGILYYTGTELYAVFCYGEDIEDMEPVSSEDKLSDTLNYVVFDELDLIRAGGI